MEIALEPAAIAELGQVLRSGCVSFHDVRVVYDTLPGRALCAATVLDGLLWVAVDLDKASAPRHALAMIREVAHMITPAEEPPVARRAPLSLAS